MAVQDLRHDLSPAAIRGVLASLALVMLAASLDSTAVGTALPRMVADLRGADLYAWVFTVYLLAMTATMPVWGSLSDRFGRKRILFIGLVVFLSGSVLCGASQDMLQLVLFRGIQGLGAGAIVPVTLAVIGDLYAPAERARIQAAFSSLFVLAFLVGPTIGGVLADSIGWRWVFYVNLPVGLLALVVIERYMPPLRGRAEAPPFDLLGAALFAAAVVPFLIGVRNLPEGDLLQPEVGGLMLLGLVMAVAFVVAEHHASGPIIPVGLFRDSTFSVASAVVLLSVAGLFVAIVFLPRYFQLIHGASATESGWQIMTLLLGLILGAIGAGMIVARSGRWKLLLLFSMALGMTGMAMLMQLSATSPLPSVWGAMFLTGLGLGPVTSVLTAVVQSISPAETMGVATSTLTFFRQLGASIWLAIGGSLFSSAFRDGLPDRLRAAGVPPALAESLTAGDGAVVSEETVGLGDLGMAVLAQAPPEARAAIEPFTGAIVAGLQEAFSHATGDVFIVGVVAVAAAFIVLAPLPERRLPTRLMGEAARGPQNIATHQAEPSAANSAPARRSAPGVRASMRPAAASSAGRTPPR